MDYHNGQPKWNTYIDYRKKEKFQERSFFQTICRYVLLEGITIKLSMLSPMLRGGEIYLAGFLGRDLDTWVLFQG